jgi:para-aminobenzoate synthetase component 1
MDSLVRWYSRKGPVILLESQSEEHPASRNTYLAALPEAVIEARGSDILINRQGRISESSKDPWEALAGFYNEQGDWLFGYLGYDLKNYIERLSSENHDPVQAFL